VTATFVRRAVHGLRALFVVTVLSAGLASCGGDVRRTYWPSGQVWSEVHFENGLPNGPCTTWHENGVKARAGEHLHGYLTGPWRVYGTDGRLLYETSFQLGDVHGPSRGWYADGTPKFVGNYVAGQPSGPWTEYFDDGSLSIRGVYLDGQRHGDWSAWHRDGTSKGGARYDRGRFVSKIQNESAPSAR